MVTNKKTSAVEEKQVGDAMENHEKRPRVEELLDREDSNEKSMKKIENTVLGAPTISREELTEEELSAVDTFLENNRKMFAEYMDELGVTNLVQHKIDTADATPIKERLRRIPYHMRTKIKAHILDMLK